MTNLTRLSLCAAVLLATAGCKMSMGLDLSGMDICKDQPKTVGSVVVTPTTVSVTAGATALIDARVKNSRGDDMGLCAPMVSWTTDNSSIATVEGSAYGSTVKGIAAGQANITLTADGKSATVQVTVTNANTP